MLAVSYIGIRAWKLKQCHHETCLVQLNGTLLRAEISDQDWSDRELGTTGLVASHALRRGHGRVTSPLGERKGQGSVRRWLRVHDLCRFPPHPVLIVERLTETRRPLPAEPLCSPRLLLDTAPAFDSSLLSCQRRNSWVWQRWQSADALGGRQTGRERTVSP